MFGSLALLSLALTLWQWLVARRFPLHERLRAPSPPPQTGAGPDPAGPQVSFSQLSTLNSQLPPVTLLKPLKGCDEATENCLRSWLAQDYAGPVQVLFGVASAQDPVCEIVRKLLKEFPAHDAQLVVCGPSLGANAKVSKLVELERLAKHELLVISDADVRVPPDLLTNVVAPLLEGCPVPLSHPPAPITSGMGEGLGVRAGLLPQLSTLNSQLTSEMRACGLVTCFYRLANPTTLAMRWEAVAINADFWSQVLQSCSLKPMDFALGAVMATRRKQLQEIGGFAVLVDCLADDYQLGNRLARRGYGIAISPVVVECWSAPMGWAAVWKHQLRWARTIRICQPVPYFFSILSNATLWPLLSLAARPSVLPLALAALCLAVRIATALHLQHRLACSPLPPPVSSFKLQVSSFKFHPSPTISPWYLILLKDLLQSILWLLAFLGNRIEWRGERLQLRRDGTLARQSGR
jgi:ceramide glucosyltransferase